MQWIAKIKFPPTGEEIVEWLLDTPLYIAIVLIGAWFFQRVVLRGVTKGVKKAAARANRERLGAAKRAARTAELTDILMSERKEQRAEAIGQLLRSAGQIVIWGTASLAIFTQLGFDIAPLLASAGVVGVALGFGAQALVKDYLSGIFLIIEDQFGVGDVVDVGDVIGTVEEITLRTTRIRDMSGVVWYIRNGEIIRVANRSQGWTMAVVDVPVAYDEDLDRIRAIIEAIADDMDNDPEYDDILLGRPEFAGVESVSGDAVFIRVFAKAAPEQQVALSRQIRERIKNAFDRAGVRVPVLLRTLPNQQPPQK
jgi:moderate conductance mechanosensitive channel